jgi:hypothetical protein
MFQNRLTGFLASYWSSVDQHIPCARCNEGKRDLRAVPDTPDHGAGQAGPRAAPATVAGPKKAPLGRGGRRS